MPQAQLRETSASAQEAREAMVAGYAAMVLVPIIKGVRRRQIPSSVRSCREIVPYANVSQYMRDAGVPKGMKIAVWREVDKVLATAGVK
jgi:hypothetical protein